MPTSTKYVQKLRECIRQAHRKADQFQQKEVQHHNQNCDRCSRTVALKEGVKDLFCEEKYKTLTASSFETGLYSVKLCEALNTTDEKAENL